MQIATKIKERPILFSTPLVQAILEGRKTMTRRVVKPQPIVPKGEVIYEVAKNDFWIGKLNGHFSGHSSTRFKCPYGQPGDRLWVRETWQWDWNEYPERKTKYYRYKAYDPQGITLASGEKWKPSIFMPREACRILLEITHIRVERLQDISPDDAANEGVEYWNVDAAAFDAGELVADYKNYTWKDDENYPDYFFPTFSNPIESFRTLWQSINGPESWAANPWVWVVEFRRVEA